MTRNKDDDWDVDIQSAHRPAHDSPRQEMARTPETRLRSGSFQRSATMTISLEGEQAQLSGGTGWLQGGDLTSDRRVLLIVCSVTIGALLLFSLALALLLWRRRAMKSRSEKIYKLRREEKDPWSESPPGKNSGCLKLCTEGIRSSGMPIYYHRASQPASPVQTPTTTTAADINSVPRHHQKPPAAPPPAAKSRNIPPPLEPSGGRPKDAQRWTDNVVYISGYSPTLERRRPPGEPAASAPNPAEEGHDAMAAYRTLPSKQKRLQQFYAATSSADVGTCTPSAGEVSPDRVDLMLLDEEMRTRSLPSWMRNKNKGKLQDASQHPLSFSHKQRNRMDNDAASVIARARTHYPTRSSQEPTIVYDVRTAL